MKRNCFLFLILVLTGNGLFAQLKPRNYGANSSKSFSLEKIKSDCHFFKGDSLNGFPFETIIQQSVSNFPMYSELLPYLFKEEIKFIKKKYKISKLPFEVHIDNYRLGISPVITASCNNLDFENGNYTGWTGGIGFNPNTNGPLSITSPVISTLGINSPETSCSFHTLLNAGVDPYGGFAVVGPGGGSWSCRLGGELLNLNCDTYNPTSSTYTLYAGPPPPISPCVSTCPTPTLGYSNGESIQQTFAITTANCLFSYSYAVVLANAPHTGGQNPYFSVQVFDQAGVLIPCLSYFVEADTTGFGIVPPGFTVAASLDQLGNSVLYTNWTNNSLNLQPYIGTNVTVKFTTAGCTQGGHFAYAYVDCSCGPLQLIVPSGEVCLGGNETLAGPPNAGGTYAWVGPGIVSGGATQTVTVNQPGTYSVTMTNSKGCKYTIDTTIAFYPIPVLAVNSPTTCPNVPVVLNATSTGGAGALTYNWIPPGGLSVTNDSTTTATVNTSTSYTVIASSVNNCTATAVCNIVIPIPPPPVFTATAVCLGQPTVINNTTVGAGIFNWDFGDGSGTVFNQSSPTHTYLTTGNFVITCTLNTGGCTNTGTTNTTVKPIPYLNHIVAVEYCPNVNTTQVNFSSNPPGPTTYAWVNTNSAIGLASSGSSSSIPSFLTVNNGTTIVVSTVHIVPTLNGCQGPDSTYNITINPNPTPAFFTSKVCIGSPTKFTDESYVQGGTIVAWAWDFNNDGIFLDANSPNPQTILTPAGPHSIGIIVTSNKGCKNQIYEPVYVNFLPTPAFVGDNLVGCPIHPVNFTESSTAPPPAQLIGWSWDFGNGQTSINQNPTVVLYNNSSPLQPIKYTVSLTVTTDSGCSASLVKPNYITVYPKPRAGFVWSPYGADLFDPTIYFTNTSVGGSGANPINYYFGDTYIGHFDTANWSNLTNPIHTYNDQIPDTYYVTQWVKNVWGCKDSITEPVTINPIFTFYIPNAFSPNGDYKNDGFKGMGIGIDLTTYNIWVFDRWGNQCFHSNNIDETWDGRVRHQGDIVLEDVYVWKVKFRDNQGLKHEYHGTVSVVK